MREDKFIGRREELARLQMLLNKRSASAIVIRGRRRIGKSRLLAEFGKEIKSLFFTGIPPTPKTTAQDQRDEFAQQLERAGIPGVKADDWGNLLWHLATRTQEGRILVVLDEISWMGGKDPNFLSKLRAVWDMHFSTNSQLILAICGSVSSWIEENILSSSGFLGRIVLDLELKELPLNICNAFWHPREDRISAYEKFKLLSITGGVPLYLEQILPELSAEQNIQALCFSSGGLLVREFDNIFTDLFSKQSRLYKEIVSVLAKGPKSLIQICKHLKKSEGGVQSLHLNYLAKAGFIQRDFTWHLENSQEGGLSRYRLSDNYLRFYLKYIAPHRARIDKDLHVSPLLSLLPNWEGVMGLQFENLMVHNRRLIWEQLGISANDVSMDGPFFQNPTNRQAGCQIDYLIQTRFNTLYLCEIKFCQKTLGVQIVKEVETKRKRLKMPRYCSVRPVLIHVNGVEGEVLSQRYFDRIIDFSSLF